MEYDVIGDIHGQAGKLNALLAKLGYRIKQGAYRHPAGRRAVFLGDLIDRGPEQISVVQTVRAMIDAGSGLCVMGNHEWNAIGFAFRNPESGERAYLRPHSEKNRAQHGEFLRQVGDGTLLHQEFVKFFRTLPFALDLDGIRAVHAWWNQPYVDQIAVGHDRLAAMSDAFILDGHRKGCATKSSIDGLTKGLELPIPNGGYFIGAEGHKHYEIRLAWWKHDAQSYRDAAIVPGGREHVVPEMTLPAGHPLPPIVGAPVFVGHYWFAGQPRIQTPKLAVLDFSAAKHGPLVAYRWDGEAELSNANFVWAD